MEKLDLKNLDIIANQNELIDKNMHIVDYGYCAKVRKLYQNYKTNQLSLEDCKKLKAKVTKEYEDIVENLTYCSKVWLEHQENLKKSEMLRAEINKSSDLLEMLLNALECISLMTGDETFYKINAEKVNKHD
ncbi:MAG: hypothetical protein LIO71_08355 [Ruminococcus sp.]|nr:hypothetical protein [Ruminococcus sp.]